MIWCGLWLIVNTLTGVCTKFVDSVFGVRSGLAYDDVNNLWFRRDQASTLFNVSYTGEVIEGATINGLDESDDSLTVAGLTCASNDVVIALYGSSSFVALWCMSMLGVYLMCLYLSLVLVWLNNSVIP
jgi:hypothetical protein